MEIEIADRGDDTFSVTMAHAQSLPKFRQFYVTVKYFFLQNHLECSSFFVPLSVLYIFQMSEQNRSLSSLFLSYMETMGNETQSNSYPFLSFCKTMEKEVHIFLNTNSIEFSRSRIVFSRQIYDV